MDHLTPELNLIRDLCCKYDLHSVIVQRNRLELKGSPTRQFEFVLRQGLNVLDIREKI